MGTEFIKKINGVFAIILWDEKSHRMYLIRDRLGVQTLYYCQQNTEFHLGFFVKDLLKDDDMDRKAGREELCELLGLGPAKSPGKTLYAGIKEVLPGSYVVIEAADIDCRFSFITALSGKCLFEKTYWELSCKEHTESYEDTVEHVRSLVVDAIKRQTQTNEGFCSLLSGGVDSSLVTAICSSEFAQKGMRLDTYSFDYAGNDVYFRANDFQPSLDNPYIKQMVAYLDTGHTFLTCDSDDLFENLDSAMIARDMPCMADIESSLYFFCQKVGCGHKVAITGECADEVFGGYPWFHKREMLMANTFPWSMDFGPKETILKDSLIQTLQIKEYVRDAYQSALKHAPKLPGEGTLESRRREIAYLNLFWFMQTLLRRMGSCADAANMTARVPFADYRLVEYVFNIPWEMKNKDGIVKGILRKAGESYLPNEVLYRKKSPYPKTYDPYYENTVIRALKKILENDNEPIHELVDKQKVMTYMETPADYGRPFYGQLMAGPQMMAYLLQINAWLKQYQIHISLS